MNNHTHLDIEVGAVAVVADGVPHLGAGGAESKRARGAKAGRGGKEGSSTL